MIFCKILQLFWRARSRLYQSEILQQNMRWNSYLVFHFRRANWRDFPRDTDYSLIFIQFSLDSGKIRCPWNINIRTRFAIRLVSRIRVWTGLLTTFSTRLKQAAAEAALDQRFMDACLVEPPPEGCEWATALGTRLRLL